MEAITNNNVRFSTFDELYSMVARAYYINYSKTKSFSERIGKRYEEELKAKLNEELGFSFNYIKWESLKRKKVKGHISMESSRLSGYADADMDLDTMTVMQYPEEGKEERDYTRFIEIFKDYFSPESLIRVFEDGIEQCIAEDTKIDNVKRILLKDHKSWSTRWSRENIFKKYLQPHEVESAMKLITEKNAENELIAQNDFEARTARFNDMKLNELEREFIEHHFSDAKLKDDELNHIMKLIIDLRE